MPSESKLIGDVSINIFYSFIVINPFTKQSKFHDKKVRIKLGSCKKMLQVNSMPIFYGKYINKESCLQQLSQTQTIKVKTFNRVFLKLVCGECSRLKKWGNVKNSLSANN